MRSVTIVASFSVLLLAGCVHTVGRDFQIPSSSQLVLGQTSVSEAEALLGQPTSQKVNTVSEPPELDLAKISPFSAVPTASTRTFIDYVFLKGAQRREMGLVFVDDRLEIYTFTSDFPNESTNFDEGKISLLTKNVTTKEEAIQLFGTRFGVGAYPMVRDRGTQVLRFYYNSLTSGQHDAKELDVLVDSRNIVKDYQFGSASNPLPQPTVQSTTIPIFIPKGK